MKILFVGDLYARPGVDYLLESLPYLKQKYKPNIIIVNGENATNGRGINQKVYKQLLGAGVGVITMGNHTWKNQDLTKFYEGSKIVKPINDNIPGDGYQVINYNGQKLLVISALGTMFMDAQYELAYLKIKEILTTVEHDFSFIDFHAELTSEKIALAHYLDGIADALIGTHTHVQTNDGRILPKGLIYLTDVGMTGPLNGVIGVKKEIIIDRFINGYTVPNQIADGPRQLNAALITLSPKKAIELIHLEETNG